MKAAISPNESIVTKTMPPTIAYDINIDAGPPFASELPVPKNNPVPIVPIEYRVSLLTHGMGDKAIVRTTNSDHLNLPRRELSRKCFTWTLLGRWDISRSHLCELLAALFVVAPSVNGWFCTAVRSHVRKLGQEATVGSGPRLTLKGL